MWFSIQYIKFLLVLICIQREVCCTRRRKERQAEISKQPHVIFIFADDLGWNDLSFHGSPQIPTPNIDALASSGIILNNHYGERLCTPSRAALVTGKYPFRFGLQGIAIRPGQRIALPLNERIMPEYFKDLGYSTHMVGKWHLGHMTKEYTPTERGFDSFFGYYNGFIDYYEYTHLDNLVTPSLYGIDLQNGSSTIRNMRGKYATELFTETAEDIIKTHDESKPLFLYFSHLAVHRGNNYMCLQAPPEVVDKFSYIKDKNRRIHAAMVSVLDASVGRIFETLHSKGMLDNSIIVFAADNGGKADGMDGGFSSNFPLRGEKGSAWEGGIRTSAIIWSSLLNLREPRTSMQLMHVSDWLPTLYTAAGGNVEDLGAIDGFNMWDSFLLNSFSPRVTLVHDLKINKGMSSIRTGSYKLVTGTPYSDGWWGLRGNQDTQKPQSMDSYVFQWGGVVKGILEDIGMWLVKEPDTWRKDAEVHCQEFSDSKRFACKPDTEPCLFNISNDPCEYYNLANHFTEIVDSLMKTLNEYNSIAIEKQNQTVDVSADPLCYEFSYVPWLDPEYQKECKSYSS